jgi:hypothetical protein
MWLGLASLCWGAGDVGVRDELCAVTVLAAFVQSLNLISVAPAALAAGVPVLLVTGLYDLLWDSTLLPLFAISGEAVGLQPACGKG